jgi:PHD/YefM family antitoxin component YafN of YafNO toxin-antitoxin module
MVALTRKGRTVAYVVGANDLAGLIETIEVLANPAAQEAIADAEAGRGRCYSLDEL